MKILSCRLVDIARIAIILITGALSVLKTSAMDLGPLKVVSLFGEPFRAEVEIFNYRSHEIRDLTVSLAPERIYSQFGIHWQPFMSTLTIRVNRVEQSVRRKIELRSDERVFVEKIELLLQTQTVYGYAKFIRTAELQTISSAGSYRAIANLSTLQYAVNR